MPLKGGPVVGLTRILAGAFCSMLLRSMRAEVAKIEAPDGGSIEGWAFH